MRMVTMSRHRRNHRHAPQILRAQGPLGALPDMRRLELAPASPAGRHADPSRRGVKGLRLPVPMLILDSAQILRFLRTVSLAKIKHQKMRIVFEKHDEQTAV